MDISLPLMSGYDATRAIKLNPLTQGIPITALTAHAMASDRKKNKRSPDEALRNPGAP